MAKQSLQLPSDISRRSILKFGGLGALAVTSSGLLVACSEDDPKGSNGAGGKGGTIRIAMLGAESDSMQPGQLFSLSAFAPAYAVFDSFFRASADLVVSPYVLESAEASADGMTWTFKLRSGVTWHDGSPATSDDIVYTFKSWSDPAHGSNGTLAPFIDFKNVQKVDDLTVTVPLLRAVGNLGSFMTDVNTAFVKNGSKPDDPAPLGTGPFAVKAYRPGGQSEFVKNENYWQDGLPYADALVIDASFRDDNARLNAVQSGQVHAAPAIGADIAKAASGNDRVEILRSPGVQFTGFTMRVDEAPYSDVRVRQAMRLIVNREQTVESALSGFGKPLSDLAPAGAQFFASDLTREQDLDQAKALLTEAGHLDTTFTIDTTAYAGFEPQAVLFQEAARQIGVKVELRRHPANAYFAEGWPNYPFGQTRFDQWSMPALYMQTLATNSIYNETGYANPEYDELIYSAIAEQDETAAAEKWHEVQQVQFDEGGYIIWGGPDYLDALAANVKGIEPSQVSWMGNWSFANMQIS